MVQLNSNSKENTGAETVPPKIPVHPHTVINPDELETNIVGVNNNTKNDTTLRIRISLTRMLGFCEAFFTIGISSSFSVKPSNYTLFLKKDDIKTSNLLNYRKFTLVFKKFYYVN